MRICFHFYLFFFLSFFFLSFIKKMFKNKGFLRGGAGAGGTFFRLRLRLQPKTSGSTGSGSDSGSGSGSTPLVQWSQHLYQMVCSVQNQNALPNVLGSHLSQLFEFCHQLQRVEQYLRSDFHRKAQMFIPVLMRQLDFLTENTRTGLMRTMWRLSNS